MNLIVVFIVPRTAWGSGWISEATCRNVCNSKQPQSKSKIVTIQAAGKKLQEIPEISRKTQRRLFCRRVFLQEITGGCRKTRQVFGNHFLRSLAALLVLWMFCFRCSFSCCQTFPGKNDFHPAQNRCDWRSQVVEISWAVSIESNGKTKWKQSNEIQTGGPAIGWNVFPWTSNRVTGTNHRTPSHDALSPWANSRCTLWWALAKLLQAAAGVKRWV